jgi:hemerythrin superfamily protein
MNAVADRMTPSITTMIRMDHSHVLALFHRFKAHTSPGRKRALVSNACLALQVHAQLEEEIFYPAMRAIVIGDDMLERSESEHNEMRRLIGDLRERAADSDSVLDALFDDKFMELMRVVMHHVADEETRLLPTAERSLGDQLGQLAIAMTKRRIELLRPHARELAASTVRSFPSGAAAGVLLTAGAVALSAMLLSRRNNGGEKRRLGRR